MTNLVPSGLNLSAIFSGGQAGISWPAWGVVLWPRYANILLKKPDGRSPKGRDVRGKVMTYAFNVPNCNHVIFQKLTFFGTTMWASTVESTNLINNLTFYSIDLKFPSTKWVWRELKRRSCANVADVANGGKHGEKLYHWQDVLWSTTWLEISGISWLIQTTSILLTTQCRTAQLWQLNDALLDSRGSAIQGKYTCLPW